MRQRLWQCYRHFCIFVHSFHDSLVMEIDPLNVISWISFSGSSLVISVGMQTGRVRNGTRLYPDPDPFVNDGSGTGSGSEMEPISWFRFRFRLHFPDLVPEPNSLLERDSEKKKKIHEVGFTAIFFKIQHAKYEMGWKKIAPNNNPFVTSSYFFA